MQTSQAHQILQALSIMSSDEGEYIAAQIAREEFGAEAIFSPTTPPEAWERLRVPIVPKPKAIAVDQYGVPFKRMPISKPPPVMAALAKPTPMPKPKTIVPPPGTYMKLLQEEPCSEVDQAGTDTGQQSGSAFGMTAADHYEDWKRKSDMHFAAASRPDKAMTADDRLQKAIDMKMEMERSVHEKDEPDFWLPDWAEDSAKKTMKIDEGKGTEFYQDKYGHWQANLMGGTSTSGAARRWCSC